MVLFQELEAILKFLVVTGRSSTLVSRLQADREDRAARVREHTLGQLNKHLLENLYAGSVTESSAPDGIAEPWLTFTFHIGSDAASIQASKVSLAALIKERNELIHHLLARWNLHDIESCRALSAELAREDGWTLLSTAGNRLRQLIPAEFAHMKVTHGDGSLQRLVIATELFDVRTEPTVNSGARALYRVRVPANT